MYDREPYKESINFTVLFMDNSDFMREHSEGEALDASKAGMGLITTFPLEPGHVLEWDDKHQEGRLHIAMVRWAKKLNDHYRAGLIFI
ncbi:MAG: hypothetical protein C0402_09805 [Thermodesulfovibrio sp.]|nr:hypothetical protein [Thermodesulfovibrio sp.]